MNYEESRKYIQDASSRGSVLGLDNIVNLMNKLGNVQDRLKVVHIAGTNGKGSTSVYITQILIEAGYTVGRYTSPAVFDYMEMFTINNINISEDEYAVNMTIIKKAIDEMEAEHMTLPTSFEIETALAYLYFYRNKCDIAIIETGMGGRLDATNIVKSPLVSVLTSISKDHSRFLGETLEEITFNKAGIIKKNCPVVSAIQCDEAAKVIKEETIKNNSKLIVCNELQNVRFNNDKTYGRYVGISNEFNVETSMLGTFQIHNIPTAIETILALKSEGFFIYKENIENGIKNASISGRCERINDTPAIYIDGGHNPGAAFNLKNTLEMYFTNRKLVYIIGVLADKDYDTVLSVTGGLANHIITVTPPDNARSLDGRELLKTVLKYNTSAEYADDLEKAVNRGIECAGDDGVLFVFGSLSYLGRIKEIVRSKKG
jgi:dihydrofolate synthase/folylpolyglutamate synthase